MAVIFDISVNDIRTKFIEFSDPNIYPDSMIGSAIEDASDECDRFDVIPYDKLKKMVIWLCAHYVVFYKRAAEGDTDSVTPVSSKKLGDASINYQAANYPNKDILSLNWNATIYGQTFYQKLLMWRKQNIPFVILGT